MTNPRLMNGMGSPQSIYSTSTTQEHTIGTRGILPDGRVFYYTRNGTTTALTKNELLVAAERVANHRQQTVAAAADVTAGATTVTANIGGTLAGVGVYDQGYFVVTDGTAQGDIYQIRDFPGGAASTDIEIPIYGFVQTTAGGSDVFDLVENSFSNPQQSNTDRNDAPVGVPLATLAAATSAATATVAAVDATYGWVQTWGPCSVLGETTNVPPIGGVVGASDAVAGHVAGFAAADNDDYPAIGIALDTLQNLDAVLVDLRIRP